MGVRIFGPAKEGDNVITAGLKCPICTKLFVVGQQYVLVAIGPDPDDDEGIRKYLTKSGFYNARARCVHDTCLMDVDPEFYT